MYIYIYTCIYHGKFDILVSILGPHIYGNYHMGFLNKAGPLLEVHMIRNLVDCFCWALFTPSCMSSMKNSTGQLAMLMTCLTFFHDGKNSTVHRIHRSAGRF